MSKRRKPKPARRWDIRGAEREAARNKALIEAGATFAGHKPSDYRLAGKRMEPRR